MAEQNAKPDTTPKADKEPKVPNPVAPRGDLPELAEGLVWDTVEISGWDFAIAVAESIDGIATLCKDDDKSAAGLFNRALRIAVPARLDARKLMSESKDQEKTAGELQTAILDFDVTKVQERAPRQPKEVSLPKGQANFSAEEVTAMLAAAGIKTVVK